LPRTILIVSSGRTGTQFLAHYFDANHPSVVARHEPPPRTLLRIASNAHAAGALPGAALAPLLAAKRRRVARLDADLYVESNPFLWGAVDVFREIFEDATIVHVVRDPREQVRSSLNHGTGRGRKRLAGSLVPFWYPRLPRGPARGDWFARAAGFWCVVNEGLREQGAACTDYRLVRYEALFDSTHSGLRELCEWLGLPFRGSGSPVDPARRINRSQGSALGGWRSWSDEQCATLHRIAGPLMAEYGYGDESEWKQRVGAGP
jgi:hypothetical protein